MKPYVVLKRSSARLNSGTSPPLQVGACIVNQDKKVVGVGYNKMPNGCEDHMPWSRSKGEDAAAAVWANGGDLTVATAAKVAAAAAAETKLDTKYIYGEDAHTLHPFCLTFRFNFFLKSNSLLENPKCRIVLPLKCLMIKMFTRNVYFLHMWWWWGMIIL